MTSIEDMTNKEGELCLGVLFGIYWKTSPDLWEKLEEGFELIPGKLRLRIFTEKDRELFTSMSPEASAAFRNSTYCAFVTSVALIS